MNIPSCFVTGTDTEVGKTRVSAGLLHWLGQAGLRAAGYKPVASGMDWHDGRWSNEDVQTLHAASTADVTLDEVGPCQFRTACAPHIAAEIEGRGIDRAALLQGAQHLAGRSDALVVEGAGGWCIPLGPDWDSADLVQELDLPVVLVVGLRLGCINHALLTAEAVRARGLCLAGWVANTLVPDMPHLARNLDTLHHEFERRFQAPCLAVLPRLDPPSAASVAPFFHPAAVRAVFGLPPAHPDDLT